MIEHALVLTEELLKIVNANLGKCQICKKETLRLEKLTTIHLAQGLGLECTSCMKTYKAIKSKICRLRKKVSQYNRKFAKDDKNKLTYMKTKVRNMKSIFD